MAEAPLQKNGEVFRRSTAAKREGQITGQRTHHIVFILLLVSLVVSLVVYAVYQSFFVDSISWIWWNLAGISSMTTATNISWLPTNLKDQNVKAEVNDMETQSNWTPWIQERHQSVPEKDVTAFTLQTNISHMRKGRIGTFHHDAISRPESVTGVLPILMHLLSAPRVRKIELHKINSRWCAVGPTKIRMINSFRKYINTLKNRPQLSVAGVSASSNSSLFYNMDMDGLIATAENGVSQYIYF